MDVRPGAVAGAAGEADHLTLLDVLVAAHLVARLVAVRGREAVVVVDDHEVAVAALPAAPDDGAGRGRMDRGALRHADVDAGMEAPPPRPERARDRPVHRPDEAG